MNSNSLAPEVQGKDGEPFSPAAPKKNKKILLILVCVGFVMFLFAFANVPIFGMLCKAVGIQVNPLSKQSVSTQETDRTVKMIFIGTTTGDIPLQVSPVQITQTATLGKITTNDYRFVNLSDRWVYFYPVHNLQPIATADMIDLSKCFCFNPQKIAPGAKVTLPVVYVVSSDLPEKYTNLTMNYSMFELTKEDYEAKQRDLEKRLAEEAAERLNNPAETTLPHSEQSTDSVSTTGAH